MIAPGFPTLVCVPRSPATFGKNSKINHDDRIHSYSQAPTHTHRPSHTIDEVDQRHFRSLIRAHISLPLDLPFSSLGGRVILAFSGSFSCVKHFTHPLLSKRWPLRLSPRAHNLRRHLDALWPPSIPQSGFRQIDFLTKLLKLLQYD